MIEYGFVKGKVVNFARAEDAPGQKPHYHVIVSAGGKNYRCPVNVRSSDQSEVWFKIEQPLADRPILTALAALAEGFKMFPGHTPGLALDYVREPMFFRSQMTHLPYKVGGASNDIQDLMETWVHKAKNEAGSQAYVFGEVWFDKQFEPDHFFGTKDGVHDVHMNQGNDSGHVGDDGVYQDGAMLFHYPSIGWVGIFLAFNSQSWFTNDNNGHALAGHARGPLAEAPVDPDVVVPVETPEGPSIVNTPVSIVAALVNPKKGDEGKETVTLFNASDQTIDFAGWRILDKNNKEERLAAHQVHSNASYTLRLTGHGAQLSNEGGVIRLVSPAGATIDSVSYSKAQASVQGKIIVF